MYYVILKKDRNPHEAGFKYGPVSKEGYIALYNDGYIDDTENLIEKKKKGKKEIKNNSDN